MCERLQGFRDKTHEANLIYGVSYYAVGLIVQDFSTSATPGSGKDYAVMYIDPWGNLQQEWRATDEIEIFDMEPADSQKLLDAFIDAAK
ncbi:hypothetical protein LU11_gp360 [Pseudomonas phage Lu11]|uniref:hypothetical protein n=1 Tax=Pseudomonas phage Lu11 TaxID=1161927 RepID=UPI00025F18C5|nr:hypothetical protein LU11_gp360 [Pseudomonas phage Lu11]AFH14891.1 hypothetical protein Lu11_0353 [Pseudomonas phage Lu11]